MQKTNENFFLNIHTEGSERGTNRADKKASRKIVTALRTHTAPVLYTYALYTIKFSYSVDSDFCGMGGRRYIDIRLY
jgi:hypothetical protein